MASESSHRATLFYVHDPMCSWCWAFRPLYEALIPALPDRVRLQRLLGGLAPDSDQPMPESMQAYLQATWHTIQRRVPGTRFNFDFWHRCQPRRSTYPACRAVIAARLQGDQHEPRMILAIQQAYYLRAMNPSDVDTLVHLAGELSLDVEVFRQDIKAAQTQRMLQQEISRGRAVGAEGFPSLILQWRGRSHRLEHDYCEWRPILKQIEQICVE